jgi:hypothetical protein
MKMIEAIKLHEDTVRAFESLDKYKRCNCCGRVLLLDERNWVRKNRSKDGFQNRCKMCEREIRKKKGEAK